MKTNLLLWKRKAPAIFLTAVNILLFTLGSIAATYYISPTGNDNTGTGTLANPWRTLFRATSTITTAGNTIHLLPGTYTETQQSNLAVGVSLEGEGITSSIVVSNITGNWSILLNLSSGWDTNGNQTISGITFNGGYVSETNYRTWWGIHVSGRSNVIIHNCQIINFYDRGVNFDGNTVFNPLADPGHYATGNKFYNNTMLNTARCTNGYGAGQLNIGGQQGMEIYNNTLIQDQRVAFKNGWPIKYWENGWLKGVKIYNNTLKKAYYQGSYPGENGDWDFAIELFNISGLEIANNQIQGCIDLNYNYKGTYAYSAWIHHNVQDHPTVNTNFESGIILEFATESVIIEDNIINNSSTGIQFNTRGPGNSGGYNYPAPTGGYSALTNNIIRRNLFSNIYRGNGTGIGIFSEGTNDPYINGLHIYNNTIVAMPGNAPFWGIDFSSQENGNCSNINIRNNIVVGFAGAWIVGTAGAGNTNINGMTVTHNDAYNNANGNTPNWPGGNPTGYVYSNNRAVNPRFISATDFRLQPASPLIDAGVYVGSPYSGTAPDGGYKEFGSGTLPISIIDFTAKESNGRNLLNWNTASEINSNYFAIERSNDGTSYAEIGRVNASGFSSTEMKYNFTDANPADGNNYYRLKMVDKDASYEYSKVVVVSNRKSNSLGIVYANLPSGSGTATILISSTKVQPANLNIIDISGRVVLSAPVELQKGNTSINKNIPASAAGIYYIRLSTATETVVRKTMSNN